MVSQFSPVPPGWRVLFEDPTPEVTPPKIWLPLLGWLTDPSSDEPFQPCVWFQGLADAEAAADLLGYTAWSVVESEFNA